MNLALKLPLLQVLFHMLFVLWLVCSVTVVMDICVGGNISDSLSSECLVYLS